MIDTFIPNLFKPSYHGTTEQKVPQQLSHGEVIIYKLKGKALFIINAIFA